MSKDFENLLQKGYYTGRDLTQLEVNSATSWIMENIVAKKRSPELFHEWESIEKNLSDPYYLTLLYNGCLSIQYFYDSHEPKQTKSIVVNQFCISIFKFLIKNDNSIDLSRMYWAKLGGIYHALKEYDLELSILNEGIVKIYQMHKWEPGKMNEIEARLAKYSAMETLLAQKVKCLHAINSKSECRTTLDLLFESLAVRGISDMINGHFPSGLRHLYNDLR
jgi:hypothetical protein